MVYMWYIYCMNQTQLAKLNIPPQVFKFTEASVLKKSPTREKAYLCTDSADNAFKIKVYPTGRRVYRTHSRIKGGESIPVTHGVVGQLRLKEARSMHQNALALMRKGINPNTSAQEEATLSIRSSVEQYIKNNNQLSETTRILYVGLLNNHLTSRMFHKTFAELNEIKFLDWYKSYDEKPSVANNCLKLLSSTFNSQPLKIRRDAENPRTIVTRAKSFFTEKTKEDVYLNPEWIKDQSTNEVEMFLELLMDIALGFDEPISEDEYMYVPPTQDQVYIDAILMLLLTAVRVDALINLTWNDVNWIKGVIIVKEKGTRGKKKERIVPLTKYTYRCLKFRQEMNRPKKSKWVFPSMRLRRKDGKRHGRDLKGKDHIDNPKHIFEKMEERSKVWNNREISPLMQKMNRHGLRRTLAKIAEHLGYDMHTLQGVLDHSNTGVTAKNYLGGSISHERLKECYETCHNFIDNRLHAVINPQLEEEQKDKKTYSPLMFLWGKPNHELALDKYASLEYQTSTFDGETTAFPDMD